MEYDNKRNRRCVKDLISFGMEMKVSEQEFLTAISDILAIALASMPEKDRQQQLGWIKELAGEYVKMFKELPADEKKILKQVGWEFEGE